MSPPFAREDTRPTRRRSGRQHIDGKRRRRSSLQLDRAAQASDSNKKLLQSTIVLTETAWLLLLGGGTLGTFDRGHAHCPVVHSPTDRVVSRHGYALYRISAEVDAMDVQRIRRARVHADLLNQQNQQVVNGEVNICLGDPEKGTNEVCNGFTVAVTKLLVSVPPK
ncbi:hypothetical protein SEMRO_476_G150550.1 [Seminavis robusta]|uniref:Uncharacterized protein n=1 Tax=Seminavis robusta TaxID=568900 RepID=A0A9N8DYP6_9STRA|nr:hypothetical protein SEMRO_476_G150550.1 [Seminavis robusta]|eukprot:Sro476_g150550.1 n/a (166) ;mRNA; f:29351-29848